MSSSAWSGFMQKSQKSQLKEKSKLSSRKRKLSPGSTKKNSDQGPSTKKRKMSNVQIECPICKKKLLSNLINFHMEEHFVADKQNQDKENDDNILPSKPSSTPKSTPKSNKNETKICPLFTSGALPSRPPIQT